MATQSQILANQENAQSSTGPTSDAGKLNSSRNAFQHGLASTTFSMIRGENQEEFDSLHLSLLSQYQPANAMEALLVHDLAKYRWLTDRAIRIIGFTLEAGGEDAFKCVAIMIRYQRSNELAFQKTLATLTTTRKDRQKEEAASSEIGFVPETPLEEAHRVFAEDDKWIANFARQYPEIIKANPTLGYGIPKPPKVNPIR